MCVVISVHCLFIADNFRSDTPSAVSLKGRPELRLCPVKGVGDFDCSSCYLVYIFNIYLAGLVSLVVRNSLAYVEYSI